MKRAPQRSTVPVPMPELVHQLITSVARICADHYPDAFRGGVKLRMPISHDLPRIMLSDRHELQIMTVEAVAITGTPHWSMVMSAGGPQDRSSAVAYVSFRSGRMPNNARHNPGVQYALPSKVTSAPPSTPAGVALHSIAVALASEFNVACVSRT